MHAAGSFTISLNRDFPFGLSLEPLQAYFAPHLNIARPPSGASNLRNGKKMPENPPDAK